MLANRKFTASVIGLALITGAGAATVMTVMAPQAAATSSYVADGGPCVPDDMHWCPSPMDEGETNLGTDMHW